ncbi:phenylalanine--tRNA ligase subunit alpha [archaeon]|nr:MAG: phenylalanine--tRNA ligase subunit alpha [archaeon]
MRENKENLVKKVFETIVGGCKEAEKIAEEVGIPHTTVMSILERLRAEGYIEIVREEKWMIELTEEGRKYKEEGLPERRLAQYVYEKGGEIAIKKLDEVFDEPEIRIALQWVVRKEWGRIERGYVKIHEIPEKGKDEKILELIGKKEIKKDDIPIELIKRGLIKIKPKKTLIVKPIKEKFEEKGGISVITAEIIRSGKWKKTRFKPYNLAVTPPPLWIGKKNPYIEFVNMAREILIEMGFEEYKGPWIEMEFYHFDALFQPQDHPARELFDTFHVSFPEVGKIPERDYLTKVKRTHENGWETGSRGWRYNWSERVASRRILRGQTTSVSIRYLTTHKEPPIRMFTIDDCFRYDVMDATHSIQFKQAEGIVGERGITLKELFGILEEFAKRLGFKEIKFVPSYFPFTEPSCEAMVYHPELGWIECLGAGIFRPEVLKPLEIDFPVLAWGIGIDRLAMAMLGINDIRKIRRPDLQELRDWKML